MIIREIEESDLEVVREHSISKDNAKCVAQIDYSYTIEHEGRVLLIGGIRLINHTTAWAWVNMTDYSKSHTLKMVRLIRKWEKNAVEKLGIKRLQAFVDVDFKEAIRFVEHFGFRKEYERPMKNFIGDKDAYLYVKVM